MVDILGLDNKIFARKFSPVPLYFAATSHRHFDIQKLIINCCLDSHESQSLS